MNDPSKPIEDTRPTAKYRRHLELRPRSLIEGLLQSSAYITCKLVLCRRYHIYFQWTPNSTLASWQGGLAPTRILTVAVTLSLTEGGWGPMWGHAVAASIAGPWVTLGYINIGKQGADLARTLTIIKHKPFRSLLCFAYLIPPKLNP